MTTDEPRKRGRPPVSSDPHRAEAYQTIGRAVWQLMAWGFDLRQQVAPAVARSAAEVLKVQNADGLPLSSVRIEQIYEQWRKTAPSGWVRGGVPIPLSAVRPPSDYSVGWRRGQKPYGYPLTRLAGILLNHQGEWPNEKKVPAWLKSGDPVFVNKVQAWIDENQLRPASGVNAPEDKTG